MHTYEHDGDLFILNSVMFSTRSYYYSAMKPQIATHVIQREKVLPIMAHLYVDFAFTSLKASKVNSSRW